MQQKKVQSQFDMWICNSSQNMAIQSACKAIKLYRSINIYKSQAFIKVRWLFICYYYYICDGAWIVLIRWVILKAKQCRFLPSMALFMWSRFLIIDIKKLFGGALCNESDNFVIISSIKKGANKFLTHAHIVSIFNSIFFIDLAFKNIISWHTSQIFCCSNKSKFTFYFLSNA